MHPEVLLLVKHLVSIVQNMSEDVRSISLSIKEVNHSILKMVEKKHSTSCSVPGLVDDKETLSRKEKEKHPDFPDVLEQHVVTDESLPHEVRNISPSLGDFNENTSCLSRQEEFVAQDVSSWISDSNNEEEGPLDSTDLPPIGRQINFVPGLASTCASSRNETGFLWGNLGGEIHGSQDSIHDGNVLMVKSSTSSNEECREEITCKSTNPLLFHDYTKSSNAADASKSDTQSANKGQNCPANSSEGPHGCSDVNACLGERVNQSEEEEKTFNCFTCNKTFHQRKDLQSHLLCHSRKTLHEGRVCQKVFTLKSHLRSHMAMHCNKNKTKDTERSSVLAPKIGPISSSPFQCHGCSEVNACLGERVNQSEEVEKTFNCFTCNKTFHQRKDLQSHLLCHSRKTLHEGRVCQKVFTLKSHLRSHMAMHCNKNKTKDTERSSVLAPKIGPTSSSTFQCQQHESSFSSVDADVDADVSKSDTQSANKGQNCPANSSEGPHGCSDVNACLGERVNQSEEEEKTFNCFTCNKTFHQRKDLQSHLLCHSRKTLHEGRVCQKVFTLKSHLRSHMAMHCNKNKTKDTERSSVLAPKIGPTSSSTFQCQQHESSFSSVDAFRQKTPTHTHEKFHQMNECRETFSAKDKLDTDGQIHRIHEQEKLHLCGDCGKSFREKYDLAIHVRTHEGEKPYVCKLCNKSFSQRGTLYGHIYSHSGRKPYICVECGKGYARNDALTRHKLTHTNERPHKCNMCESAFHTNYELKSHKFIHSDERSGPYSCTECKSRFKHKNHLHAHYKQVHKHKVHEHEVTEMPRAFLCDRCGKSFRDRTNFTAHVRIHTGEKPYKCNVCNKSFAQSTSLASHMLVHTGEKPYQCKECGKAYKRRGAVTDHRRTVHTGERPYTCSICGKAFVSNSKLSRHKRIHLDERPYTCSECNSSFKRKTHLSAHQRRVHKATHPFS